jgi:hypothetical protein
MRESGRMGFREQQVPQKQVFDFKPAPRPEQVGDKRHKQMKERKHHVE